MNGDLGVLNIAAGSTISATNQFIVGNNAGANGTVNQTGGAGPGQLG